MATATAESVLIESEGVAREERRGDPRVRTVYCTASITSGSDTGLCRIHNISNGGVRIETGLNLAPGETVRLSLSDGEMHRGRVAWRNGKACGIRFLAPIDSGRLLRSLVTARWTGRSRPPRISLHRSARIEAGALSRPAIVRDISQNGMKLRHAGELMPDQRIGIHIEGCFGMEAIVRWSHGGHSGIELIAGFSVDELESAARI